MEQTTTHIALIHTLQSLSILYKYSRTSLAQTQRDCQNLFKLLEVRATEVS